VASPPATTSCTTAGNGITAALGCPCCGAPAAGSARGACSFLGCCS
jgi:hypothetical protein